MRSEVKRAKDVDRGLAIESKPIETNCSDFLAVLIEDANLHRRMTISTLHTTGQNTEHLEQIVSTEQGCVQKGGHNMLDASREFKNQMDAQKSLPCLLVMLGGKKTNEGNWTLTVRTLYKICRSIYSCITFNLSLSRTMPRTKKSSSNTRHDPLLVQLNEDELEATYGRLSQPGKRKKSKHSSQGNEESGEVVIIHPVILSDSRTLLRLFWIQKHRDAYLSLQGTNKMSCICRKTTMWLKSKTMLK